MRIYLVRHASHSLLGRVLCGRSVDIGLDMEGRRQARALGDHFAHEPIDLIQCSPRRRARETAEEIGVATGHRPDMTPALDEHDPGEWAGLAFEALANDSRWQAWNERRGAARPPQGENMRGLQQRVVDHIESTRTRAIDNAVMVSHAEPIRAALLHYRGIALDDFQHVQVEPASIHVLHVTGNRVEVRTISAMAAT